MFILFSIIILLLNFKQHKKSFRKTIIPYTPFHRTLSQQKDLLLFQTKIFICRIVTNFQRRLWNICEYFLLVVVYHPQKYFWFSTPFKQILFKPIPNLIKIYLLLINLSSSHIMITQIQNNVKKKFHNKIQTFIFNHISLISGLEKKK